MSSNRRTRPNKDENRAELGGLSTAMIRHSRNLQKALDGKEDQRRPKLAVVSPAEDECRAGEIRPSELHKIRTYVRAHRRRDLLFCPGLFGDPNWDMLLDMFIARGEGRKVSMDSVCLAADVPTSTAWRKFAALEKAGLVARNADPEDRRRTFVELSPLGIECIRNWLSEVGECGTEPA